MKTVKLRELSVDELLAKLNEFKTNLAKLSLAQAKGELKDKSKLSAGRHLVARTLTILTQKGWKE